MIVFSVVCLRNQGTTQYDTKSPECQDKPKSIPFEFVYWNTPATHFRLIYDQMELRFLVKTLTHLMNILLDKLLVFAGEKTEDLAVR